MKNQYLSNGKRKIENGKMKSWKLKNENGKLKFFMARIILLRAFQPSLTLIAAAVSLRSITAATKGLPIPRGHFLAAG